MRLTSYSFQNTVILFSNIYSSFFLPPMYITHFYQIVFYAKYVSLNRQRLCERTQWKCRVFFKSFVVAICFLRISFQFNNFSQRFFFVKVQAIRIYYKDLVSKSIHTWASKQHMAEQSYNVYIVNFPIPAQKKRGSRCFPNARIHWHDWIFNLSRAVL